METYLDPYKHKGRILSYYNTTPPPDVNQSNHAHHCYSSHQRPAYLPTYLDATSNEALVALTKDQNALWFRIIQKVDADYLAKVRQIMERYPELAAVQDKDSRVAMEIASKPMKVAPSPCNHPITTLSKVFITYMAD